MIKKHQQRSVLNNRFLNAHTKQIVMVVTLVVVGVALLVVTRAATPATSFEAEAGTPSKPLGLSDPSASGSRAIKFMSGGTSVGGLWLKSEIKSPAFWQSNLHFNWQEQNVTTPTGNMNLVDVDLLSIIPQKMTVTIPNIGSYNVDIDTTANASFIANAHAKGIGVICYIDTGAVEDYWPDYKYLSPYKGPSTGWAGEFWMNVDNQAQWGSIMLARIKLAADIGCDGVEGDENDGAQNGIGTLANEITWYKAVANAIHDNGMTWAIQKNGYFEAESGDAAHSGKTLPGILAPYFDAILIEQPYELKNSGANYAAVTAAYANAGKPVFAVDYTAANGHSYFNSTTLAAICAWDKQQGFEGYIFHDDPDNTYRYECGP